MRVLMTHGAAPRLARGRDVAATCWCGRPSVVAKNPPAATTWAGPTCSGHRRVRRSSIPGAAACAGPPGPAEARARADRASASRSPTTRPAGRGLRPRPRPRPVGSVEVEPRRRPCTVYGPPPRTALLVDSWRTGCVSPWGWGATSTRCRSPVLGALRRALGAVRAVPQLRRMTVRVSPTFMSSTASSAGDLRADAERELPRARRRLAWCRRPA